MLKNNYESQVEGCNVAHFVRLSRDFEGCHVTFRDCHVTFRVLLGVVT